MPTPGSMPGRAPDAAPGHASALPPIVRAARAAGCGDGLRVVDGHLHYVDFTQRTDGFPALAAQMDAAGVSQAVVFGLPVAKRWDKGRRMAPSYYLDDDSSCYYYSATDFILLSDLAAQPPEVRSRFIPFVCGFDPVDGYAVSHIERMIERYPGVVAGIGEVMCHHDDLSALTLGETPRMDNPALLDVYDFAAAQALPVLVHQNITRPGTSDLRFLGELRRALEHNRSCRFIWAHMGVSRRIEIPNLAGIVGLLLSENDNLHVDISWLAYDNYFLTRSPDGFRGAVPMEGWAELIERWPDRFIMGTDAVGRWGSYADEVAKYRPLVESLSPAAAAALLGGNILRLTGQKASPRSAQT